MKVQNSVSRCENEFCGIVPTVCSAYADKHRGVNYRSWIFDAFWRSSMKATSQPVN